MKRPLIALCSTLLLAGHVQAQSQSQSQPNPSQTEASPFSIFVYDALGATPSIRIGRSAPNSASVKAPDSAVNTHPTRLPESSVAKDTRTAEWRSTPERVSPQP